MTRFNSTRAGILMGIAAYLTWGGVIPIYLKALFPLAPMPILAMRVLWSLLFLTTLAIAMRARSIIDTLRQPRLVGILMLTALLISANWLIYIYAISIGHVLEASLGYFISPLLNVLLGVIFLRERLGRTEKIAVALAAAGVALLAIWQQAVPLLPLALATSFGLYGLVRKMIPVDALDGLFIETALLSPIAIGWLALHGGFTLPADGPSWPLVAAGGIVTAGPMLLFTGAARRVRFTDLGLLQYISPTMQMTIAIFVFGEPIQAIQMVTFALIWAGLAIYASATWRRGRAAPVMPPE